MANGKGGMEWLLDVLKTLLPSIVLAVIGYYLNDTVEHTLKERELRLEAVKAMQEIAPKMQDQNLTRGQAQSLAAQVATFGSYSVPFFVNVLEVNNQYTQFGSEQGLRMVARSEPEPVCSSLTSAIQNRYGLYRWQTHLSALKVLGQAGCVKALPVVQSFRTDMKTLADYQKWVSGEAAVEQPEYETVLKQADDTLDLLKRAKGDCQQCK